MEAFVVAKSGGAALERIEQPTPADGECLLKVLIAGVCNTDLEILKGYMGFSGVVGHEFVATVLSGPQHLCGKRVVGDINLCCRKVTCATCARADDRARNHCPSRSVLGILNKDGAYAEYLTLPAACLHPVPDCVSTENAAFAEPLAAACRIVEQKLVAPGDKVAVVGDGKLGLLIIEVLARYAAEHGSPAPLLVGRHPERAALIPSAPAHVLASDALPEMEKAFDVVVDATGSPSGLDLCTKLCRPMGTLVLKSTCAAGSDFNTAPFVIDEIRVAGSRCGPFPDALAMLAGGLDLSSLISATFPLSQAPEAVAKAGERGVVKVQIRCASDDAS